MTASKRMWCYLESVTYKCPSCSAPIVFDGVSQSMKCSSCGNAFETETLRQFDEAMKGAEESDRFGWESYGEEGENWLGDDGGASMYECPSCSGQIVGDSNTAASFCPYCGNPAIMPRHVSGMYRPDYIIPFSVTKEQAKAALRKFYKGKPLLPKASRSENRIESITGIYVPFWLYDCCTDAQATFRASNTRSWSDSKYNYTKTDYYLASRSGNMEFEKVPVDGSVKLDDKYMEAIEPFDYTGAFPFSSAYLSGFFADKYDLDAEKGQPRANQRIKNSAESALASTVTGYSSVKLQSSNVRFSNGVARYALFPVWLLNSVYRGKTYSFAMNGQTGKFVGVLPASAGRSWAWFGGIAAGLTLIVSAIAIFGGFLQ